MTLSADTFAFVADLVRRRSAIDLIAGKEYLVESRLAPFARQAGLTGVDEYVQTLRMVPDCAEHDRVVEALTTNETSWFRDINPFRCSYRARHPCGDSGPPGAHVVARVVGGLRDRPRAVQHRHGDV